MSCKSHIQKVCSLYKRATRCIDAKCENRLNYRYNVTVLRSRFDANKNMSDMQKANELIEKGEKELYAAMFVKPKQLDIIPSDNYLFKEKSTPPDWVLDRWYPLEPSDYPEYFERREQRKKEYMDWWNKKYGKASVGSATS